MLKKLVYIILFGCVFATVKGQGSENYIVHKTSFSTDKHAEFAPVYYINGLVYTTDRKDGLFTYTGPGGEGFLDLYYVDTTGGSKNMKPELFSKNLNSKFNDGPATFHPQENTVYFSRNLYIEGNRNELSSPRNRLGLFSATRKEGEWGDIREFRFNSEWYNIISPFISPDGERLYFASDMPDGYGGTDLYYCERKDGYWEQPVNLGPVINTPGNEGYPFENRSGEFFFSSDGHPGMGGKDIFYSRFNGKEWLEPIPLNPSINSEHDDFGLISDPLMSKGYFSSNRDGSIDVFEFHALHPQVFTIEYQEENIYCYTFHDTGDIQIDFGLLKYVWNFGDGSVKEGLDVKHCYQGPGEYDLRLDIVEMNSNRHVFRKLDYILEAKEIVQPYIESPDIGVAGEEINFSARRSNLPGFEILEYFWNFGDGSRGEGEEIIHSYSAAGEYDVILLLTMRSLSTGGLKKESISKKIRIAGNQIEKQYLEAEAEKEEQEYFDFILDEKTSIDSVYNAENMVDEGAAFCLELLSSESQIDRNNDRWQNIPDKYLLSERYDPISGEYKYTVELQENLMSLYPAWKELTSAGFSSAQIILIQLRNPEEKELFTILKNFDKKIENYFDNLNRINSNAYVLLDRVVRFMNNHPEVRIELSVHSDNLGNASSNLSNTRRRAEALKEYLVTRNIDADRIIARGYGEIKPVAPNTYEANRRLNRRVEIRVLP